MLALLTNLSGKADFQDSLQSVQDTVAVASDSTGTVAGAGEEMGRAVDLLASGDIYSFSQQMKVIFINSWTTYSRNSSLHSWYSFFSMEYIGWSAHSLPEC